MSLGNLPDRQYLTLTLRCTPLSFLPCTDFLIGNSLLNSTNLSCSEMSHREPVFDSARLKLGPRFISALVAATVQVDQANKHGKGSRQAAKGHGRGSGNTADAVEWNIISCIETAAAHVADTAMACRRHCDGVGVLQSKRSPSVHGLHWLRESQKRLLQM